MDECKGHSFSFSRDGGRIAVIRMALAGVEWGRTAVIRMALAGVGEE